MGKKSQEKFIQDAIAIHGNKYDYSQINYVGTKERIKIGCAKHGIFWQIANGHLNGSGCPKCGIENHSRKWSAEDEKFLMENYYSLGLQECCKTLQKSRNSIFNKVSRLGLTTTEINYYKEIPSFFWVQLRKNAQVRHLKLNIKIEDIWDKFISQNRKCALTGMEIKFDSMRENNTCSVDRIDSMKGYEIDNIQLVNKFVNVMKMHLPDRKFYEICKMTYLNLREKYES